MYPTLLCRIRLMGRWTRARRGVKVFGPIAPRRAVPGGPVHGLYHRHDAL